MHIEMKPKMPADLQRCVDFHGHMCGGLAMGYRASKAAMEWLREHRALDEELVAIVETDACGADAVQVLTGCTFGKGNFIFRDYGKMAFTFFSRNTGQGVRVASRPKKGGGLSEEQKTLFEKRSNNTATPEDLERLDSLGKTRAMDILNAPLEQLFTLKQVSGNLPSKARIEPSQLCDQCGEPVMATRLEKVGGRHICRGCLESGN
ncbi:MAG: FmdE family protein [Pseudomonadota bacterium]